LIAEAKQPVIVYGKGVTRPGSVAVMKAVLDLAAPPGTRL